MTQDEKDKILYWLDEFGENMYAVLTPYSNVSSIKDKEFQQLRMDYLEARHALLKYIGYN